MIAPLPHPTLGPAPDAVAAGLPIKFSRAEAAFDRPAPELGADNERVYGELLNLTPAAPGRTPRPGCDLSRPRWRRRNISSRNAIERE